jgi:predicted secreted protein
MTVELDENEAALIVEALRALESHSRRGFQAGVNRAVRSEAERSARAAKRRRAEEFFARMQTIRLKLGGR